MWPFNRGWPLNGGLIEVRLYYENGCCLNLAYEKKNNK